MSILLPALSNVLISLTASVVGGAISSIEGLFVECYYRAQQVLRGLGLLSQPGAMRKERGHDEL